MSAYVPLSRISALNPPPPTWLMAVLKAYLDDSGDEKDRRQHDAVAIAGYLATAEAWQTFEARWQEVLRDHRIYWLHMKEFEACVGQFASWKGDEARRDALIRDACAAIKAAGLHGFGAVVRLPDLERFNLEKELRLEPMPLAIYLCMNTMSIEHPDDWIEVYIDRMKECPSKVGRARQYAASYFADDVSQSMEVHCLERLSAKQVRPMQAADLAAYEALKHEKKAQAYGRGAEVARRPWFDTLLSAAPLDGPVADYRFLCDLHEIRRGVWRGKRPPHPRFG